MDRVRAWEKLYSGGFPAAYRNRVFQLFDAQNSPRILLKEGTPSSGEVELTLNWNGEEITESFKIIEDPASGELRFRFKHFKENGALIQRTDGHPFDGVSTQHVLPANSSTDPRTTLNPNEIQYMQDGISNATDEEYLKRFTLKNAYEWHVDNPSGAGIPDAIPPLEVWRSLDPETPGLWTLNHRRLAAYKLAGYEQVDIVWVSQEEVIQTFWEMTTATLGKDMNVKVYLEDVIVDGELHTYFRNWKDDLNPAHNSRYEALPSWLIKTLPDGSTKAYKSDGSEINILIDILPYLD